jgi:hypothetical protein
MVIDCFLFLKCKLNLFDIIKEVNVSEYGMFYNRLTSVLKLL